MLKEGDLAPDFTLPADTGEDVTLSDFRGHKVVLYFYPRDNTPGCTTEACSFRDDHAQFMMKGAVVIGVSPDSAASHVKFKAKFGLPFHLLSDLEHKVLEAYGAWGEKTMYGKKVMGVIRSTFVIDEHGVIVKAFPKVKVDNHARDVLQYL
ncbi:MAG: thioredoxin-dependent thiol peroxidase [Chloroflexi bacterium]|nr:thioredoxin-dependent thiol peroxidase [Chloroflexota bacterium]